MGIKPPKFAIVTSSWYIAALIRSFARHNKFLIRSFKLEHVRFFLIDSGSSEILEWLRHPLPHYWIGTFEVLHLC